MATDPEPMVFSYLANLSLAPSGFYPNEWAVIGVDVSGDTEQGPGVTAKVDIVFCIDESGSMKGTDPSKIRHRCIKQILLNLNPSQHRAAIVVFSNEAEILGGYSSLTTDFNRLSNLIDGLPDPDGFTNMSDAIGLANSLLTASGANHRISILLTDGYPETEDSWGYDTSQDAEIRATHLPYAILHDINYHVVHLAPSEWNPEGMSLLLDIAELTGGQYLPAQNADRLASILPSIVQVASTTLVLKDVSLDIQFNFGTNEYSAFDDHNIIVFGAQSYQVHSGGRITTERCRQLPINHGISIRIPVTANTPIPPGSPPEQSQVILPCFTPAAVVKYHLGDNQFIEKQIPQVFVTWLRPPDVLVLKRLDPGNRSIKISVTNFIRTDNIRDVRIKEVLSRYFEAEYSTLTPHPKYVADYFDNGQNLDYFYWELGDIAPLTTKAVWFNFRYCGPPQGNVGVDFLKAVTQASYVTKDGKSHTIERWYGDNYVNAGSLNVAPSESRGPDIIIHSNPILRDPPTPRSNSIWNDAFADQGYNQEAIDAAHANPEPLDLNGRNKLWIRIDNCGNRSTSISTIKTSIYIKGEYNASMQDLDNSTWILLGTLSFGSTGLAPGSYIVKGFEWNPSVALSPSLRQRLRATYKYVYIKVVASIRRPELRLNNNSTVTRIPIAP